MHDTLKTEMGRTVAQVMAVFAVVFGLLNAQCLAVCTANSCKPVAKRPAPVKDASSHCHPKPAQDNRQAPTEGKQCAHETLDQGSWQEVKPVLVSFTPTVELQHVPIQTLSFASAAREILADAVSPPSPGIVSVTVLRI